MVKHWTVLKWPPVELLRNELKHGVWRRQPSDLRHLAQFAQEEWDRIPAEVSVTVTEIV